MQYKKIENQFIFIMINILMAIFIIIWLIPALALFVSSFRNRSDIVSTGWWYSLINPLKYTLDNYQYVLTSSGIARAFINSLIIAIPSTILTILTASIAAYPIAFYQFKGRLAIFTIFIILQIIPIQITMIPGLKMLKFIKLSGTFPGTWLAHTAYGLPFAIYLLRNFFSKIPFSLIESAQIDGTNKFDIFRKIIIPLSAPVFASLGIFQFLWVWNDLLVSLVYLGGTPEVAVLTVKITSMMGSLESGWHIITTSAFISMILPICLFLFLQKYFIKGILAGAVKE